MARDEALAVFSTNLVGIFSVCAQRDGGQVAHPESRAVAQSR